LNQTRVIELGNKEDLSNANLEEFGIAKEEELDITLENDTCNGKW
jgi:hypothetical protein